MITAWRLIFSVAIAVFALVSEQAGDHVVLGAVEAPEVDKLANHESHDGPEAADVRNQVKQRVTAPRVDLQIQVTLNRDLKLGSIFVLVTAIGLFFESENAGLFLLGQVRKIEKVVLEEQFSLGDHKRLGYWHESVDA